MERETDTHPNEPANSPRGGIVGVVRRVPRWALLLALVLVAVPVVAVVFDVGTASPGLCAACHEMGPRHASWAESSHVSVRCVECHQEPTAWYELPRRVVDRGRLLGRDISAHVSGEYDDPVDSASPGAEPVSDAVCLQCHDVNRKATSGYRIIIDHAEHAKRNGSCVSCHVRTAHPIESRGTALSLMGQCYTCHGTAEYPDAPTECGTCHPADYELLPATHAVAVWATEHGTVAQTDEGLCTMCHVTSFCDDCHGLEMPHPDDWVGENGGHGAVAEADAATCEPCHGEGPDLCTMCHHTSYAPLKSPWIEEHNVKVIADGSDDCLTCHTRAYCSFCHTRLVEDGATE